MSQTLTLVFLATGGAALLVLAATSLLAWEAAQRDLSRQVQRMVRGEAAGPLQPVRTIGGTLVRGVRQIGMALQATSFFSARDIAELERSAAAAGFNPQRAVPMVMGGKVLLVLCCPVLAYTGVVLAGYGPIAKMTAALAGVALGMFGPNWLLGRLRGARGADLRRGLPDALDLLVVCAEAGLGLETAVDRVATEMRSSSPAIAAEFAMLGQDLRRSSDRGAALIRLGERTALESFTRLAGTLSQTLRYGTPVGQALRLLAGEMRTERLMRLEEKAARLPVLLSIPLALFILPSLFLVVAGPVVIRIMNMMHH